jgi:hypothetical protein
MPGPPPQVPTWSVRASAAPPSSPQAPPTADVAPSPLVPLPPPRPVVASHPVSDIALDPMTLRRRVTIRSGASALVVDEARIVLRVWWRRREIPWSNVLGFEPRFDGVNAAGSGGRLVALTVDGAVDLPATKRPMSDLRYIHALLDAYRMRSQLLSNR